MNTAGSPGRNALILNELQLPTIGRLWTEIAARSDKEGWPASRFLGGLLEHELTKVLEKHSASGKPWPASAT